MKKKYNIHLTPLNLQLKNCNSSNCASLRGLGYNTLYFNKLLLKQHIFTHQTHKSRIGFIFGSAFFYLKKNDEKNNCDEKTNILYNKFLNMIDIIIYKFH